jgi:hypothetical protein
MSRRDPSSRVGGARAWASVEVILEVELLTLWKALGIPRWRVCWARGFVAVRGGWRPLVCGGATGVVFARTV